MLKKSGQKQVGINMKLRLEGWRRRKNFHDYPVTPVMFDGKELHALGDATPLIDTELRAGEKADYVLYGRVNDLSLNGDYLLKQVFTAEEIFLLFKSMIEMNPSEHLAALLELNSTAIKHLQDPEVKA